MEILITVADPKEIAGPLPFDFACYLAEADQPILITGMGEESATALDLYLRGVVKHTLVSKGPHSVPAKPDMVVNIGTCVSKNQEMTGTVHYFNKFRTDIEKDTVPTGNVYNESTFLYTSPKFITSVDQMGESYYGDMEAFHLMKVCKNHNVGFMAIKVVSDCAESTSPETWLKALPIASSQVRNVIKHVCQQARNIK